VDASTERETPEHALDVPALLSCAPPATPLATPKAARAQAVCSGDSSFTAVLDSPEEDVSGSEGCVDVARVYIRDKFPATTRDKVALVEDDDG